MKRYMKEEDNSNKKCETLLAGDGCWLRNMKNTKFISLLLRKITLLFVILFVVCVRVLTLRRRNKQVYCFI
jgi:uncharacterized SAM-binding protein YcdF (DUF218 family)